MHHQAVDFTKFVKRILPDFFINKTVLDVGSGDINGNNRYLFEECIYDGNDVIEAKNVTIVSKTKDLNFNNEHFDTIISTECFEHDPEYKDSLLKICSLLKKGGLFVFTCASTGRPEHGTRRTTPQDSFGTRGNLPEMQDYYKNLTREDIHNVLQLDNIFHCWDTYFNSNSHDLYFVGIKKNENSDDTITLPRYEDPYVVCTTSRI